MQFLIVLACALAAASAGYVAPLAYYPGAQHFPVINQEGVPVDTASVQHAKAAHYAHTVNVQARNGEYVHAVAPYVAHQVVAHDVVAHHDYHHQAYPTTAVHPVSVDGVPQETPEVVAAKSHHFAAHAEALARTGYPSAVVYRHRRGVAYAAPVAYSSAAYTTPVVAGSYAHHVPAVAHAYGAHAYNAYPYGAYHYGAYPYAAHAGQYYY